MGEMPRRGRVMSAATGVVEVERVFLDDPALSSIVVHNPDGEPSCLTRARFFATLTGRLGFGRSLYLRHALWQLEIPETPRLPAEMTIADAARMILARPDDCRYDDCVVRFADGGYGTLCVADLFAELAHTQAFEALHDALTGLANRRLFLGRLRAALADAGSRFGVLFVDVDDFKAINDGLGHDTGDAALTVVADRLQAVAGPQATVARLGGDEFAVLLPQLHGRAEAEAAAECVVAALSAPLRTADTRVALSASVGIALAGDGTTDTELLRNADLAMYAAKRRGKGVHAFYERHMQAAARFQLELRSELEGALAREEFFVEYQPIVRLADATVAGAEALLRWRRADGTVVSPGDFIPLCEQSGLIIPIGRWVLHEACRQAAQWARARGDAMPLRVTVNVSPRQLQDPRLADDVAAALADSGLPPWALTLEMTEGVLISDLETAVARLGECRQLGVEVALDDFGSGFSSLGRLAQMPIDVGKLDRAFVSQLDDGDGHDGSDRGSGLVAGVVGLGHSLQLTTIGEGVETPAQAQALRAAGCRFGQGFYWARPMAGELIAGVSSHPCVGIPSSTAATPASAAGPSST